MRGASAKEISRDALLEKVSHERELRSYARRANAAVLFIQVNFFMTFLSSFGGKECYVKRKSFNGILRTVTCYVSS